VTVYHALSAFALAAGFLTITPGLDTALILRTSGVEGSRRAVLAAVGVCVGLLTWGLAASVGLAAVLAASNVAYRVLRIAGAGYLTFLGLKMLLRKHHPVSAIPDFASSTTQVSASASRWFVRGLLTNLLNPKVGVFYVTFLPQFIPAGVALIRFSMLLAAIHATEGIVWFGLLILATRPLSQWLRRPRVARTLDRTTGIVLVGFGLGLVLDNRR
jgi:threonine/homoserine/homoserine lactone efflux protein